MHTAQAQATFLFLVPTIAQGEKMSENMGTSLNQSTSTEITGSVQTSTESTQTTTNEGSNDESFLDGLFGDTNRAETERDETETEETTEESEETENGEAESQEESTEQVENQEEKPFLTIKYNGEDENLTMEQAIELAQKGRNYDKKEQQYQDLKSRNELLEQAVNSKPFQVINQISKELGLTAEQFADYLTQYNEKNKYNQVFNSLKAKYPNADDEVINQLTSAQLNNNYLKKQNLEAQNLGKSQMEAKVKVENELREFHDKYPNVTDKDLTDDVLEDIKNGMNVTQAYEKHLQALTQAKNNDLEKQIEELKKQLEATKTNNKVKQKSTGSLKGNGNNSTSDPFLDGLFG